eukprot:3933765-Rhodomonas_salina.1
MSKADCSTIPAQTRKPGRPKRTLDTLQAQGSERVECDAATSEEGGRTAGGVTTERPAVFSLFRTAPAALPFDAGQEHRLATSRTDKYQEQLPGHTMHTTTHLSDAEARPEQDQDTMMPLQDS